MGVNLKNQDKVDISIDELQELIKQDCVPDNKNFNVKCKNAAELPLETLEKLRGKVGSIQFFDEGLNMFQNTPYSYDDYKKCREKIDELLSGVIFPGADDKDKEKKIWGQVCLAIAQNIKYDSEVLERGKISIKKFQSFLNTGTKHSKRSLKEMKKVMEKYTSDFGKSQSMIGGFLYGESVCAGYSEIVRNTLACCGIEATVVSGIDDYSSDRHTWNQVKLDGEWFNMDLTWARDRMVLLKSASFLLASDYHFNRDNVYKHTVDGEERGYMGHGVFSKKRTKEHKCNRTILPKVVKEYYSVPTRGISYKAWLKQESSKNNTEDVNKDIKILDIDMKKNNAKVSAYDIDERD